jgi:flagellar biogenesis protein FliO
MSIIGIILVLFLTYYCTKWISTRTSLALRSKYMYIEDKIMLGQNKFIAIAQICNKYYLLSITEKHISILKELEDFQPLDNEDESSLKFNKIFSAYKNQLNRNKQ